LSNLGHHTNLWPPESLRAFAFLPWSPIAALLAALADTFRLLFQPFRASRWVKLSAVCLFLGGGSSSAAFHWSLGTLPAEVGFQEKWAGMREYVAENSWLLWLAIALGLALGVALVYWRATCRLVLIDAIIRREVQFLRAARALRPLVHSYFLWVLGALVVVGVLLAAALLVLLPYLRTASVMPGRSWAFAIALAGLLLTEVIVGVLVALLITLTDDLVLPIMYAERLRFLPAWRQLWRMARGEVRSFAFYVLLRFAASVGAGVIVLLLLFPILVTVFSGATITGALTVLTLRLIGVPWVWNAVTVLLASLAVILLIGILLVVLGVGGMPGQVFLQNYGVHFVAPRLPALEAELDQTQLTGGGE
jgi:hypothetical protein